MFYLTPIMDEVFSALNELDFVTCSLHPRLKQFLNFDDIEMVFERIRKMDFPIAPSYPVTNIAFNADGTLELELGVTGFGKDDLEIYVEDDVITIKGIKKDEECNNNIPKKYLHRKLVCKNFEIRYKISDKYDIENPIIELSNGLLRIKFNFKPELQFKKKILEITEK